MHFWFSKYDMHFWFRRYYCWIWLFYMPLWCQMWKDLWTVMHHVRENSLASRRYFEIYFKPKVSHDIFLSLFSKISKGDVKRNISRFTSLLRVGGWALLLLVPKYQNILRISIFSPCKIEGVEFRPSPFLLSQGRPVPCLSIF